MKIGICPECKKNSKILQENAQTCKEKPLIAGLCMFHYNIFRKKVCLERKKNRMDSKNSNYSNKNDSDSKLNLVYWYENRMLECEGRCAECGQPISKFDRHSSIAHVLPKKENHGFPSVATHPLNALELGPRCGCHNRYDVSWLSASKMKIFPEAIEIAVTLYPLLTQEEKARFPEVFEPYLV